MPVMECTDERSRFEEIYGVWHQPTQGPRFSQTLIESLGVVLGVNPAEVNLGCGHYVDLDMIDSFFNPNKGREQQSSQFRFSIYGILDVRVCELGYISIRGDKSRAKLFGQMLEAGEIEPTEVPSWRGAVVENAENPASVG